MSNSIGPNPHRDLSVFGVIKNHFSQAKSITSGERWLHFICGLFESIPFLGWFIAACEGGYKIRQARVIDTKTALSKRISQLEVNLEVHAAQGGARSSQLSEHSVSTNRDLSMHFFEISKHLSDPTKAKMSFPPISTDLIQQINALTDDEFTQVIAPSFVSFLEAVENIDHKNALNCVIHNLFQHNNGLLLNRREQFITVLIAVAKTAIEESNFDKADQLIAYAEQIMGAKPDSLGQIAEANQKRIARAARIQLNQNESRPLQDRLGFEERLRFADESSIVSKESLNPRNRIPVQDSRLVRGIQNKLVGSPGDIPQPRGGSQPVFGSEARTISSVSRDILAFSSPKKRRITYNLHKHKIKELLSLIKSAADAATSKENQENLYPNLLKFIVLYNDKISTKAALFLIQKIKMSLNVDQLALLRKEFKERAAFLNPIRPNEAAFLMRCFENLTN